MHTVSLIKASRRLRVGSIQPKYSVCLTTHLERSTLYQLSLGLLATKDTPILSGPFRRSLPLS